MSNRALKAGFAAVILVAAARIAPANRTPALNSGGQCQTYIKRKGVRASRPSGRRGLRWHQSPAFGRIALASGSSTTRLTTNATTGITWVAGSSKLSRATTKAAGMLRHPAPSAKTFRVGLSAAPSIQAAAMRASRYSV